MCIKAVDHCCVCLKPMTLITHKCNYWTQHVVNSIANGNRTPYICELEDISLFEGIHKFCEPIQDRAIALVIPYDAALYHFNVLRDLVDAEAIYAAAEFAGLREYLTLVSLREEAKRLAELYGEWPLDPSSFNQPH